MGHSFSDFTVSCNHDITYQFTCQKCGAGVGPFVHAFAHSAVLPEEGRHLPLTEVDRHVLTDVGYIRLVSSVARVYRDAAAKTKDAYTLLIFENLCPACGKYQDWSTVRGLLRPKKVERLSERLYPVIDWRLEQLSDEMRLFFEDAARDEEKAAEEESRLLFGALRPGVNAAIIPDVLGETRYEAAPFQSIRHNNAPDLKRGERAVGYYVLFDLRWLVVREGRIARIV